MLDPPPERRDERFRRAVSPSSSSHVVRHACPRSTSCSGVLSSTDALPRNGVPLLHPPPSPRSRSSPPDLDMALKSACFLAFEVEPPCRWKHIGAYGSDELSSPGRPPMDEAKDFLSRASRYSPRNSRRVSDATVLKVKTASADHLSADDPKDFPLHTVGDLPNHYRIASDATVLNGVLESIKAAVPESPILLEDGKSEATVLSTLIDQPKSDMPSSSEQPARPTERAAVVPSGQVYAPKEVPGQDISKQSGDEILSILDKASDRSMPPSTSYPGSTNADASTCNLPPVLASVPELGRIVRLQKYLARRLRQLQMQRVDLQTVTARSHRLARTAHSVQRVLAECIRTEDKASFLSVTSSFDRAVGRCTENTAAYTTDKHDTGYPATGFDQLSGPSRAAVLQFLTNIRYSGDFIADRVAMLTHKEVLGLLPGGGSSKVSESVLGASTGSLHRSSRYLTSAVNRQAESLESETIASPLETMVQAVEGFSGSSGRESQRALGIWSTVCSRLIIEQKSGFEKFVPAILNIWAVSAQWPGKDRLELWLLQTLRSGAFLADQPSKQTFRMRIQARPDVPGEDQVRAERFYTQAVYDLLDLLADSSGASVIPEAALQMCRTVWRKLQDSPLQQRAFPAFIATRWLCTFFSDVITLPEGHGLLGDFYVSEHARLRVMREVTTRTSRAIFDVIYSWRNGSVITHDLSTRVEALLRRFRGHQEPHSDFSGLWNMQGEPESFNVMAIGDVVKMIRSLYPDRKASSFVSDQDTLHSGVHSSSSSISGVSLFQNTSGLEHVSDPLSPPHRGANDSLPGESAFSHSDVQHSQSTLVLDQPGDESEARTVILQEACWTLEKFAAGGLSPWIVLSVPGDAQTLQTLPETGSSDLGEFAEISRGSFASYSHPDMTELLQSLLCQYADRGSVSAESSDSADMVQGESHYSWFKRCLEDRITLAQNTSDFVGAHACLIDLRALQSMCAGGSEVDGLRHVFERIETNARQRLVEDEGGISSCEAWIRSAIPVMDACVENLTNQATAIGCMRDKMWYVADVRTSAAYDEARSVAGALRIMAKPKRTTRTPITPPLRHWSSPKLSTTTLHLKTEAQILELLSAVPEQGGPNKLSDDQARTTARWMEVNNIDNFCRGEERLHRLCMELRKCTDQLTTGDNSLLAANPLFVTGNLAWKQQPVAKFDSSAQHNGTASGFSIHSIRVNAIPSIGEMSSASHPLSSTSSYEYLESRSPTLTHKSSAAFWSPATTDAQSPSSATSLGSYQTQTAARTSPKKPAERSRSLNNRTRVDELRERLTGLLVSDLAASLFSDGSETDLAFWTGLGGALIEKQMRPTIPDSQKDRADTTDRDSSPPLRSSIPPFDFMGAFKNMLRSFAATTNPSTKLRLLYDIDCLLPMFVEEEGLNLELCETTTRASGYGIGGENGNSPTPRTAAKVKGFCHLFRDTGLRPPGIFRDLQYIAALLPAGALESTPQGRAFWNAAVAILDLRQQARIIMVATADSIIAYHSNNRGHGRSSSTAQQQRDSATFTSPSRSSSAEEISHYTMADAAHLLQITAKEGDAVAQRELATLYLTHPDLTDHIIAPFARPREVFKEELESKWKRNQDPNRCDPATMCVAHHWMSLSAKGGDGLAAAYLRQREEMDRLL